MEDRVSAPDAMRWDDLRLFLLLCRTGTLTGAARALGVHPSTAHRRLAELETALGTQLFERAPSGLTPTAAGEAMRPLAGRVEEDVDAVLRAVAGLDRSPRGSVHLTAPEPLLPILVEPLACFRSDFPAIDLQVSFADRFFDLSRREADVALRPSPAPPEDAVGRRLGGVAWAVYVSPAMVGKRSIEGLPWAVYGDSMARLAASEWWRAHHRGEPVLLTVNSVSAMHRVTACSPCRGLLPCFVGDPDPALRRVGAPISAPESGLWLLVHPDLRRTARVRVLLDHLWAALEPHRDLVAGTRGD
jgi:DNA-binding transcriptional LysR family regulator